MNFRFQNIATYHQHLRSGETTCTAATEYYLGQIEEQKHLNAFVSIFGDEALARAKALDEAVAEGKKLLPLHGVVIGLKDVFCYKDHPVTAASKMLQGFKSLFNATVVERLLQAGAIIIGATNCDEFAMGSANETSFYGPALNPHDPERVPGGSSGGTAAAVAAGLCMVGIGSDTGGSVRQPADYCGIFGLKPTYGRISRYGLIAYASSFDCVGLMARELDDIGRVYNEIAGSDGFDSTAMLDAVPKWNGADPDKKYRIGWLQPALEGSYGDAEIPTAIHATLAQLSAMGHTVFPIPFDLLDFVTPAYYVMTTAEASSNLSRYDGLRYGHQSAAPAEDLTAFYSANRSEGFGKEVQRRIMLGTFVLSAGYYDAYFSKAQQVRQRIMDETARIFSEADVLVMPVSPTIAPRLHENEHDPVATYMADIFTVFANLAGIPALAIPLYKHSSGMPFGLQILAGPGNEITLQQVGSLLYEHCCKT